MFIEDIPPIIILLGEVGFTTLFAPSGKLTPLVNIIDLFNLAATAPAVRASTVLPFTIIFSCLLSLFNSSANLMEVSYLSLPLTLSTLNILSSWFSSDFDIDS